MVSALVTGEAAVATTTCSGVGAAVPGAPHWTHTQHAQHYNMPPSTGTAVCPALLVHSPLNSSATGQGVRSLTLGNIASQPDPSQRDTHGNRRFETLTKLDKSDEEKRML